MVNNALDLSTSRRNFAKVVGAGLVSLLFSGCYPKDFVTTKTNKAEYPKEISPGLELIADIDDAHRQNASVLTYENLIHVIGGSHDWQWTWPTAKYSTFNPDSLVWTPKPEMPVELAHMAAFVYEGDIITVGGKGDDENDFRSGPIVNHVFRYSPDNERWTIEKPFPTTIASAKAVIVEGDPYILGGYTSFQHPKRKCWGTKYEMNWDVFMYDKSKKSWYVKTKIPTQVSDITAAAHEGKIYIFGSEFDEEKMQWQANLLQTYDPRKDTWNRKAMPGRFDEMYAFVKNNDLLLWVCEKRLDTVQSDYTKGHALFSSLSEEKWKKTDLPEMLFDVGGLTEKTLYNNQLYLLGPVHPGVGFDGKVFRFKL